MLNLEHLDTSDNVIIILNTLFNHISGKMSYVGKRDNRNTLDTFLKSHSSDPLSEGGGGYFLCCLKGFFLYEVRKFDRRVGVINYLIVYFTNALFCRHIHHPT